MPQFDFVLADRYRLTAPLGEGGMATVYRARDLRLNRDVALKLLREDLTRDPGFLRRFQREAEIVASLAHPNIVPVYDVGEEDGSHFIVMEYVRGRTLKDVIEAGGALPSERATDILVRVLDALAYAHGRGLVHRDVKPQNILVGLDGTPRLADFGIAHLADGSSTRTAAILGSAQYLSPEQSRGEEATALSDIYAAGVVLYEMLSGHPPFDGPNALSIAHQHLHEQPAELSGVPESVQLATRRAMAKDPASRFDDAMAFAAALGAATGPTAPTTVQPLAISRTEAQPLTGRAPVPGAGRENRMVMRRSTRKSTLLSVVIAVIVGCAGYVASTTVVGQDLPNYPSTPYMALPGLLLLALAVMWVSARSRIYMLDGHAAVVQWGILGHHRYGVPLHTVAALELKQSPIDRLLGLGTIEMAARDAHGREQRVVIEDVAHPREIYDQLVRLIGRSLHSQSQQEARTT